MNRDIEDGETAEGQKIWQGVKDMLGQEEMTLGYHWSYNLRQDPKRLGFVLSRYKFAAKMACRDARILELGCSEGIGVPILAEFAQSYTGVDLDRQAIADAQRNFPGQRFIAEDFLEREYGAFEAVISMDVVEHIYPEQEHRFWSSVHANLAPEGVAIIGTPNITSAPYASEASNRGHVNLFDAARLKEAMEKICHNVFLFGINDEYVHTGYHPMCHFLVAMGCYRRDEIKA